MGGWVGYLEEVEGVGGGEVGLHGGFVQGLGDPVVDDKAVAAVEDPVRRWVGGWVGGWVAGWMEEKARLGDPVVDDKAVAAVEDPVWRKRWVGGWMEEKVGFS